MNLVREMDMTVDRGMDILDVPAGGLALTADGEIAYDFGKPAKVSDLESSGYRLYVLWIPE